MQDRSPDWLTAREAADPFELLTLTELSRLTKRSRRALYRDIADGRLRTVRLGHSIRVPRVEAERYVYGNSRDRPDPDYPPALRLRSAPRA